ncbi:hypothetical protein RIF23_08300 [Lipingzhangella sp. LS1_29]|uniref:Integral membrane protein n=1 Tax=Lipingzhangella rawalii TaxID=2055835 RepID=A0ABU2H4S0_9ACTN|nr:hypothetical protein [Lipingzhangella rawalii]MDS1270293.1 hypothetical protein [Lipingzhangella rawalii]
MVEWFTGHIVGTGRLPLFCFFVSFVAGFLLIRISVRLVRAQVRWWPGNLTPGGVHVHHVVFGVALLLLSGVTLLALPERDGWPLVLAAAAFGLGAALVLDEFALILHLRDVYWTEQGRTSVDAVFVAVALTGLLLLGVRPFGWTEVAAAATGASADHGASAVRAAGFVTLAVLNLAGAIVSLLKGKIWLGLAGVFLPGLSLITALRLAVPGSPWARWRYPQGSVQLARAQARDLRLRRPMIRVKIRVQELIAGRHDLQRLPAPVVSATDNAGSTPA